MASTQGESLHSIKELRQYFYPESGQKEVLLAYHGVFDAAGIESVVKLSEGVILQSGSKRRVMKRIGSMLIELLQNIQIHGPLNEDGNSDSFVLLSASKEHYIIQTGNLVLSEEVDLLSGRLEELNSLSPSELRKRYIETLCNEDFSYKGGAGLGFLTVAKKAATRFNYRFESIGTGFSYFLLEVKFER
jgi:hypothetical protein